LEAGLEAAAAMLRSGKRFGENPYAGKGFVFMKMERMTRGCFGKMAVKR